MDTTRNQQPEQNRAPSRKERLNPYEATIVSEVMTAGDVSLRAMYAQLTRLMEQMTPHNAVDSYQSVYDGRQHQFEPAVGASAVSSQPTYETAPAATQPQNPTEQADIAAWEQQMSTSPTDQIDLTDHEETYHQPAYLNDAVHDAVAEAERLVAEAYKNDPYARPEGTN
jgi:hypothetical protein